MTAELEKIRAYLAAEPAVEVAWLYGSRAVGLEDASSDYDLAVALDRARLGGLEPASYLDDLAYHLQQRLSVPVSMVDINRVPVPLAYNIISQGRVLCCRSDLRLRAEEQRVWSLWEEYKAEHERHRAAL